MGITKTIKAISFILLACGCSNMVSEETISETAATEEVVQVQTAPEHRLALETPWPQVENPAEIVEVWKNYVEGSDLHSECIEAATATPVFFVPFEELPMGEALGTINNTGIYVAADFPTHGRLPDAVAWKVLIHEFMHAALRCENLGALSYGHNHDMFDGLRSEEPTINETTIAISEEYGHPMDYYSQP